jgi:hypothetical protein
MPIEDDFKEKCLEKWNDDGVLDERLTFFDENFDEWKKQVPDQYIEVLLTLLKELKYYTKKTANRILVDLHEQLKTNSNYTIDNTVFAYIKSKDGISNSSNDYWTEYKLLNNINRNICYENLNAINETAWECIENIVFIDDFSGSGKSIIAELTKYKDQFKEKNVYIIIVCAMGMAVNNLKEFGETHGINIRFIYSQIFKKAFEQKLFSDNNAAKEKYVSFAKSKNIGWELGFKDTEALVSFYNNTPNNTLGFILYKSDRYFPLFPRIDDQKPIWQTKRVSSLKRRSKERKNANYNNTCKDG